MLNLSYSADLAQIQTLSAKIKELPVGEQIQIENVPKDQASKLKMNLTLSGFIQVKIESNGSISAHKPNVN